MDNLRAAIKNLFCFITPSDILNEKVKYNSIDEELFQKLGSSYMKQYSDDEVQNMYSFLENEFRWQNYKYIENNIRCEHEKNLNVFQILTAFCHAVLAEENGTPVCQYVHILRWRDMIVSMDEDLFITAFLAIKDKVKGRERVDFFWKPVIGHNNMALNRLVDRGIAENHFHLKGSAPHFLLSWLSLMNQVNDVSFDKVLKEYNNKKLQKNVAYNSNIVQENLSTMWRQAALVRLFLYSKLTGRDMDLEETTVFKLLKDANLLVEYSAAIQKNIDFFRWESSGEKVDYMLCKSYLIKNKSEGVNEIISGERWFLYSVYLRIFSDDEEWCQYANLFYFYLVAKTHIRMELIQANNAVGFHNFLLYQNRKEDLIEGTLFEKPFLKMAVRDTILNQRICSLEARITPKDTADKLQESIKKCDASICSDLIKEDGTPNKQLINEFKEHYFYTIHFIKEKDTFEKWSCRHFKKRAEVEKQAKAIWKLKERKVEESCRIYGIDAASEEIVCRPEVFAQAFRYLKNYSSMKHMIDVLFENPYKDFPLRATYHAGEDFLDVIDGLRAIEEAIVYLNLNCGDRLGHALALGIDIDEWYEKKNYRIVISKQDYLDNLVWLYARIRKMNISECEDAVHYIEKRFDEYFVEVYKNNISSAECKRIAETASEYYGKRKMEHGYNHDVFDFSINEYYDAWKLRGDNPELYKEGYFKPHAITLDEWDYHGINREYPANYRIRYVPETAFLYYSYHYNEKVKEIGNQKVEIRPNQCIIEAVKKVQKAMQKQIAKAGIGIETNPSSNYLIGNFKRYDKHPIVQWYNVGLTYDKKELDECVQLQVSINTDDQGVFATSLENEYAYLALALEKCRDTNGEYKYSRSFVLEWLETIRKMGISQSFKEPRLLK